LKLIVDVADFITSSGKLEMLERSPLPEVCLHIPYGEIDMSRLGILGATALSLSLAIATPALAQHAHGGGGMRGGGGMHFGGGAGFRGAQANIGAGRVGGMGGANFAGRGGAQYAQGGFHGDREFRGGGFGAGAGFVAGLAAGSALGLGYGYDPTYYGDGYAYNDYYDGGYSSDAGIAVPNVGVDPAYCAQRYRSYDPASGTYLGYDGLRHACS
jgi:BA14K-like protein